MTAFDIAWSVLKALPEQQAFTEAYRDGTPIEPQPLVSRQFSGHEGKHTVQERQGTVPPPIMGAMRRLQGQTEEAQRREWMGKNPLPLDMNVTLLQPAWMQRGERPKNFGPWMTHGRLSHVPK